MTVDHPADDVLTADDMPDCSADARDDWQQAVESSQQVIGFDPVGSTIGRRPESKTIVATVDNWFPVDGRKHALCGLVNRFEVFDGFGDEVDFNHFLIPNSAHTFLRDDPQNLCSIWGRTDDPLLFISPTLFTIGLALGECLWDCADQDDCLEAEVTPQAGLYGNPWFPRRSQHHGGGVSYLVGREICVYGPWVTELLHGHRPEIHPAESFWWRSREITADTDKDVFRLLSIQDDSGRFHRWASSPIDSQYLIAFEAELGQPARTYEVLDEEPWQRNVVTSSDQLALRDADDGRQHALVYDGDVILRTHEIQDFDDNIGVRFLNVCREGPSTLRGYVSVRTAVGLSFGFRREGFYAVRVERDYQVLGSEEEPQSPPGQGGSEDHWTRPQGLAGSLRVSDTHEQPTLLIDLEIGVPSGAPEWLERPEVLEVWLVAEDERIELAIEGQGPDGGVLVPAVPIPSASESILEVLLDTDEVLEIPIAQIAATVRLSQAQVQESAGDDAGWQRMLEASGWSDLPAPAAAIEEIRVIEAEVIAGYSVVRGGEPAPEESSPLVGQLNEALATGGDALAALFGEERPFEADWSFVATGLTTGEPLEVVLDDDAGEGEVSAVARAGEGSSVESLRVTFPETAEGSLIELRATLTSSDRFGVSGETGLSLVNYRIVDDPGEPLADALLDPLAAAAGLEPETLEQLMKDEQALPGDATPDPRARRAVVLWYATLRFADDGEIAYAELVNLLALAERLRLE